jgi:NADH dehydrogenase (ubiquinone) Fe-S protein 1
VEPANFFAQSVAMAKTLKAQLAQEPINVSKKVLEDFYQTDAISRASPTMAKCVTAVKQQRLNKYAKS